MLSLVCVYAQVVKTRRKDRVVKVERKRVVGTQTRLEEALFNSEDSSTINTSFIERHNLTIRQGSSYLGRRTACPPLSGRACHARDRDHLDGNMALLMCHYNFIRPHSALKFGKVTRTPAMQAGIVSKRLSFRDIFTSPPCSWRTSPELLFLCLLVWSLIQREMLTRRAGWSTLTTVG